MIIIRNYTNNDFGRVLNLLNQTSKFDSFTKELLEEKLYKDPNWNIESTLVVEHNNEIIAFMQGVLRNINGSKFAYIKLMGVAKNYQRQGIATQLYEKLEKWFIENGAVKFRFYDSPLNYFMPGIDPRYTPAVCFVEKLGFKQFDETCNLIVDLTKHEWNIDEKIKELSADEIIVSRATEADKNELFSFISKEWALWQNELEVAYKLLPIAIHIARYKNAIKAFSAHSGNNIGTAWFGPMGTHPDLRGRGIGHVLLYKCLEDLKQKGFKQAIIPWVGPISFYSNYADAIVDRIFWRYEKSL